MLNRRRQERPTTVEQEEIEVLRSQVARLKSTLRDVLESHEVLRAELRAYESAQAQAVVRPSSGFAQAWMSADNKGTEIAERLEAVGAIDTRARRWLLAG